MDRVSKAERELVRKMQRQTNADRIRAMTDEELAEFQLKTGTEYSCPPPHYFAEKGYCANYLPNCKKCWIDWLKQECADEST